MKYAFTVHLFRRKTDFSRTLSIIPKIHVHSPEFLSSEFSEFNLFNCNLRKLPNYTAHDRILSKNLPIIPFNTLEIPEPSFCNVLLLSFQNYWKLPKFSKAECIYAFHLIWPELYPSLLKFPTNIIFCRNSLKKCVRRHSRTVLSFNRGEKPKIPKIFNIPYVCGSQF